MNKYKLSVTSIFIGIACIVAVVITNYNISIRYLTSDGKTQALFGVIEATNFYYKYYFIIIGLFSLVLGLLAIKKKEKLLAIQLALVLSILAIISIFVQLWKLMI